MVSDGTLPHSTYSPGTNMASLLDSAISDLNLLCSSVRADAYSLSTDWDEARLPTDYATR